MIENSDSPAVFDASKQQSVWFWKALLFLRIGLPVAGRLCGIHSRPNFPSCIHDARKEFWFLKYYEVFSGETFPLDSVDSFLSCHRLRWQRSPWDSGRFRPASELGIIPTEIIRGFVHIVRAGIALPFISKNWPWRKSYDRQQNEKTWKCLTFSVLIDFSPMGEEHDFHESLETFLDAGNI